MKYAGIGSRATPPKILAEMGRIARTLSDHRWTLRTGGAAGADLAFERAHIARREIFNPRQAPPDAIARTATALAAAHHPAWDRCSTYAKLLHARNSHIVLGARLDDPVDAVVCWTPSASITGGTGQAIRLANAYSIPVYNLGAIGPDSILDNLMAIHYYSLLNAARTPPTSQASSA